ncbi:hypothetical protein N665_0019s0031 [Sinapis alba]|nr:hypothetical protein N665_0019s0031 [Sinapis alba]
MNVLIYQPKENNFRQKAWALYCLREIIMIHIHEVKRLNHKPRTQNRISKSFCISLLTSPKNYLIVQLTMIFPAHSRAIYVPHLQLAELKVHG